MKKEQLIYTWAVKQLTFLLRLITEALWINLVRWQYSTLCCLYEDTYCMKLLPHCCLNSASRFCTLQAFDDELPWHTFNTLTQRNRYKNRIQLVRPKQRNAANSVKWVDIQHPFYWFLYYVSYISSQPEDKRRPSYDIILQKAPRFSSRPIILC